MRGLASIEIIIAAGAAIFAFVVSLSARTHRTRTAAIIAVIVSLLLLLWDRYLYVTTSRGLLDTLTCAFVPSALPCQNGPTPEKPPVESQAEPLPVAAGVANSSSTNGGIERPSEERQDTRTMVLSNLNARSIWTTSVYSYAPGGVGPGGGLVDDRLRIGGWGDIYVALLSLSVAEPGRPVRRAILTLRWKAEEGQSTQTPMRLLRITSGWGWRPGDRLWWRNLPSSQFVSNLPTPNPAADGYEIDITSLYNDWALSRRPNFGIMLAPVSTNNNFNTFYSTRAGAALRPRLTLTY